MCLYAAVIVTPLLGVFAPTPWWPPQTQTVTDTPLGCHTSIPRIPQFTCDKQAESQLILFLSIKFSCLILRKVVEIFANTSDFKAEMHQIWFWLGLRPRPHWGSSPRPRSWILGALLLREGKGKGKGGKERGRMGRRGERPYF